MIIRSIKLSTVVTFLFTTHVYAAISMDRIRVIYPEEKDAITINIENKSTKKPYLAQAWLENDKFEKVNSPLIVLPPIQRVDPENKGQIKIKALPEVVNLPKDKESIFYFNLREIPPASDSANTLQIALQTRVKLFYRPTVIKKDVNDMKVWSSLKIEVKNNNLVLNNTTPYFITVSGVQLDNPTNNIKKFEPVMVYPKSSGSLGISLNKPASSVIITYINDYGGSSDITFKCKKNICNV